MYYQDLNPDSLVDVLKELNPDENESFFIMIGENNKIDVSEVIENINNVGYSFFGGIFPGLLFRKTSYTDGLIITKVRTNSKTQVINNLNDNSFIVPEFENLLGDTRKKNSNSSC